MIFIEEPFDLLDLLVGQYGNSVSLVMIDDERIHELGAQRERPGFGKKIPVNEEIIYADKMQ